MTVIMAATRMLDVTVGADDLRRALIAVLPHAAKKAERTHLHRVRCYVAPDTLTVTGTDGYTVAAALVPVVVDHDHDAAADFGHLDLSPADAAKILAVFRIGPKGHEQDDAPDWLIRIEVEVTLYPPDKQGEADVQVPYVRLTDVSGFIPGAELELPMLAADEHAPHVPRLVATQLARPAGALDTFGVGTEMIARFTAAAKAYGSPLLQSVTESPQMLVIRVGDSFIGCVRPLEFTEDDKALHKQWLEDWCSRLPAAPPGDSRPE
ncbi:hypothetical protein [Gordonia malaquae]|uniref:hypothetical protein n=1 Tax=Gordonia malaquae TaxID=410332 RepID=UPI003016CE23